MVDRLLRIRTGKHPHEIAVVVATTCLGVAGSIAPQKISAAVNYEFDYPWAVVFWATMAVFGAITIVGVFVHKIEGLLIERIGLAVLAILYGTFIYAVAAYAGWGGLVSMGLPFAFMVGNVWRCWQIRTDLALLKSYLKDHPTEQVR